MCGILKLQLEGSKSQVQYLWPTGLVAPWHGGGSSEIRIVSVSPEWAGRFLTTGQPRKS